MQHVPVLANGVNEDEDWLQVELACGERGWGFQSNFRCHALFTPTNTATATLTPTKTASVAPTLTAEEP